MLGIPELDEMICKQLSIQDLAQCARVCKKWHRSIIPILWHTLVIPSKHHEARETVRNTILEDYRYEQQLQLPSEASNQQQLSPFMPTLR
ncbi:hypothetical protein BGZ65_010482, partial [Modicella reniformis]